MTAKQEYDKKRYAANPERFRKKTSEYKRLNREKVLLSKRISYHKNKEKQHERKLIQNYGLTKNDFNDLLRRQGGRCAVCGTDKWGSRGYRVDHDHHSGFVRGILCVNCNWAIGYIKDDPKIAASIEKYLTPRRMP